MPLREALVPHREAQLPHREVIVAPTRKPKPEMYFRDHFTKIVPYKIFCALPSDGKTATLYDTLELLEKRR